MNNVIEKIENAGQSLSNVSERMEEGIDNAREKLSETGDRVETVFEEKGTERFGEAGGQIMEGAGAVFGEAIEAVSETIFSAAEPHFSSVVDVIAATGDAMQNLGDNPGGVSQIATAVMSARFSPERSL